VSQDLVEAAHGQYGLIWPIKAARRISRGQQASDSVLFLEVNRRQILFCFYWQILGTALLSQIL
jgi:hypothetical protein